MSWAGSIKSRQGCWGAVLNSSWWWGGIFFALVATMVPYWIFGWVGNEFTWDMLWRVPVAPRGVFDTYAHLQQMSLLKAGVQTGAFSWFTWPLVDLIRIFPSASIPEIWILSRWVVTVLLFWVGAWCIRKLTGTSKNTARWLIMSFWLSFLLVIGLRPGVFSWYMPFGYLGIGMIIMVSNALKHRRWLKAGVWTLVAVCVLTIYPWFLIYGATILVVIWSVSIIQIRPRWFMVLMGASTLIVCVYGLLLVIGQISLDLPVSFATYERNGVMFSRLPLISNTVLASVLWLCLILFRGLKGVAYQGRAVELLVWFWTVLLAVWLSTPFVGVFIENDHFIILVAMLAWLNAALYVTPSSVGFEARTFTKLERFSSLVIAIFSSLFFLYILQKGWRQIAKIETYAIHLSIWLSLAWSAWFAFFYAQGGDVARAWKIWRWVLGTTSLALGSIGLYAVVSRGLNEMPDLRRRVAAIAWIQEHVPITEAVCSDPVNASIYGAHAARQTYPVESNMVLQETDDVLHRRLITIGSAYDTVAAGDENRFFYLINGLRASTCAQGARMAKLLHQLGLSPVAIDSFIGCQQRRADVFEREVMTAITAQRVDDQAFRSTCPWVIIPDDRRAFWRLPSNYEQFRISADTSIWHAHR